MYSLSHIGIRSSDLDRSIAFYTRALGGIKVNETSLENGSHLVFIAMKDFQIELIYNAAMPPIPGNNHLAIQTPSLEESLNEIQSAGFPADPSGIRMGPSGRLCFIKGPDEENIEFNEVLEKTARG